MHTARLAIMLMLLALGPAHATGSAATGSAATAPGYTTVVPGTLTVGVKSDYAPFASRRLGRFEGYEADIARRLARALGLRLRLVPVTSASRFEKLAQNRLDMLLATVGDTAARRAAGDKVLVQPHHYVSGTRLLLRRSVPVASWNDLAGLRLCGLTGNYSNLGLRRLGARLMLYGDTRALQNALGNGVCDGWAYDNTKLEHMAAQPRWSGFRVALPLREPTHWSAVLAASQRDGALHGAVVETFGRWHRDGTFVRLAQAHGLDTAFLRERQARFARGCEPNGATVPPSCRLPASSGGRREAAATAAFGTWLASRGIDLPMLVDRTAQDVFVAGALTSVALAVATFLFAFLAGGGLAWALCASPSLGPFARAAVDTSRTTPPVLQLLVLFYVAVALSPGGGTVWSFWIAVFILGLHGAAISAHAVADSFRALPPGPFAPRFAQAYDTALETVASATLGMAKASPMAAIILAPELVSASRDITLSDRGYPWETYLVLLLFVVALVWTLYRLFAVLERWGHRWLRAHGARAVATGAEA